MYFSVIVLKLQRYAFCEKHVSKLTSFPTFCEKLTKVENREIREDQSHIQEISYVEFLPHLPMNSRRRRLSYPRGSFSVILGPQMKGHKGSLNHTFVAGFLVVQNPIRRPFAFELYGGFPFRLRTP